MPEDELIQLLSTQWEKIPDLYFLYQNISYVFYFLRKLKAIA